MSTVIEHAPLREATKRSEQYVMELQRKANVLRRQRTEQCMNCINYDCPVSDIPRKSCPFRNEATSQWLMEV